MNDTFQVLLLVWKYWKSSGMKKIKLDMDPLCAFYIRILQRSQPGAAQNFLKNIPRISSFILTHLAMFWLQISMKMNFQFVKKNLRWLAYTDLGGESDPLNRSTSGN